MQKLVQRGNWKESIQTKEFGGILKFLGSRFLLSPVSVTSAKIDLIGEINQIGK